MNDFMGRDGGGGTVGWGDNLGCGGKHGPACRPLTALHFPLLFFKKSAHLFPPILFKKAIGLFTSTNDIRSKIVIEKCCMYKHEPIIKD